MAAWPWGETLGRGPQMEKGRTDQKNATKGLAESMSAHRRSMSKALSRFVLVLVLGLAAFTAATTTSGFSAEPGTATSGDPKGGDYQYQYNYQYQNSARQRSNPNENNPATPAPPRHSSPNKDDIDKLLNDNLERSIERSIEMIRP
jgi:hypothetical protein